MNTSDLFQLLVYLGSLLALTPLLGAYMARVLGGQPYRFMSWLRPIERIVYRLAGVNPAEEMRWTEYAGALLIFSAWGFAAVLCLQMFQGRLGLNPQHLPRVPFWLAVNTAVSFLTNTNWQAYSGEATMSYLTQMLGLTVHNFVSAAAGLSVFAALARGLARRSTETLGNFWADLTRVTLYLLIPLSFMLALVLAGQGVVQTLAHYPTAHTLEGASQAIPVGPAASQVAIKQLGTNGGGFFGQNSSHPFENPTPLSNCLEVLALLLIPAASTYAFGRMIGDRRHGWCLFAVMAFLFLVGIFTAWHAENALNPVTGLAGSLEGKELRVGVFNSIYWMTATTATSCGAVNCMHDSLSPLAGLVALVNMQLGEVVFGGVGSGMYGMILFVILTVFIAGLMVGRTPEYLGKKIEAREMIWTIAGLLVSGFSMLIGAAIAYATPAGMTGIANAGPHGFSEILYAYTQAAANNGSAFAGLSANTDFYNISLSLVMLFGRFGVMIPALVVAGSLVRKRTAAPNPGTFPTNNLTFILVLIAVILILGALTFFPALTLGPVVEHFLMLRGRAF
jgi:potassium-transporting ATPase potassium-binding subunit